MVVLGSLMAMSGSVTLIRTLTDGATPAARAATASCSPAIFEKTTTVDLARAAMMGSYSEIY